MPVYPLFPHLCQTYQFFSPYANLSYFFQTSLNSFPFCPFLPNLFNSPKICSNYAPPPFCPSSTYAQLSFLCPVMPTFSPFPRLMPNFPPFLPLMFNFFQYFLPLCYTYLFMLYFFAFAPFMPLLFNFPLLMQNALLTFPIRSHLSQTSPEFFNLSPIYAPPFNFSPTYGQRIRFYQIYAKHIHFSPAYAKHFRFCQIMLILYPFIPVTPNISTFLPHLPNFFFSLAYAQKLLFCPSYAKTIIIRLSFRYPIIPSLPKKEKRLPFPRLQNKI